MPEYTSLRIDNYNKTQLSKTISTSLMMFLDWGFVDAGAYNNVRIATTDIRGSDRSKLRLVKDPNYTDGQVWETFHNNLVYESGVSVNTPINISGVYINGTFSPLTSSGNYYVDYPRGRVVFNTAQSTSSVIKMEYSYKNVIFLESKNVLFLREIQFNPFDLTNKQFNQPASGDWSLLGDHRINLPMVAIEGSKSVGRSPYELGSFRNVVSDSTHIHIIAEDDEQCKHLADIIGDQYPRTIFLLDLDMIAKSGDYPLDYRGSKVANLKTYPQLVGTEEDKRYRLNKLDIVDANIVDSRWISFDCYKRTVKLDLEIIH